MPVLGNYQLLRATDREGLNPELRKEGIGEFRKEFRKEGSNTRVSKERLKVPGRKWALRGKVG